MTTGEEVEECKKMRDLLRTVMCHSETVQDKNSTMVSWRNTLVFLAYLPAEHHINALTVGKSVGDKNRETYRRTAHVYSSESKV